MIEMSEDGKNSLTQLLKHQHPAWENLRITGIGEIIKGWETKIYCLSLHYETDGKLFTKNLILRLFQGPYHKTQASKEFAVMKRVRQYGIPVPRVDLLVMDNPHFKDVFIVMEKIDGETMGDRLSGASEHETLKLMKLMVAQFVRLHQVPWQKVLDNEKYVNLSQAGPLAFVESILLDTKTTVNRFALREFDPFLHWLEERVELGATTQLCVMHNDYHPLNLLLRESNGKLSIIDWSFAEIGDYRLDLAWSLLLFGVSMGVQYRKPMIEAYEDIAGAHVDNLEYFEVLKFTARMLTIATWLDESVVIPVKKITREAIRNEYKVHVLNVYNRLKEITDLKLPTIETL